MNLGKYDYQLKLDEVKQELSVLVPSRELRDLVSKIVDQFAFIKVKHYYHSKYNAFIHYDYEPFTTDGFNIEIIIECTDINKLKWIRYWIEKSLMNTIKCEKIFELNINQDSTDYQTIKELMEA